ncbi:hypothetical protein P691DRAFT_769595 [Macrolepiota fuliginosa MF-IS2]|uniref:Uncharacterized protein n=1 Tax=Macrolepiota fuliginosa MF-IS2 TaxID=1400762 RepID=A0A9P6BVL2_9AGAR|nr:hypothetical protein P691DRAFT_769595 [Macrolepiota fuliginosa MF-IS2]
MDIDAIEEVSSDEEPDFLDVSSDEENPYTQQGISVNATLTTRQKKRLKRDPNSLKIAFGELSPEEQSLFLNNATTSILNASKIEASIQPTSFPSGAE